MSSDQDSNTEHKTSFPPQVGLQNQLGC